VTKVLDESELIEQQKMVIKSMQDQIHQLLSDKRSTKTWKQSTTVKVREDSEDYDKEKQELKTEIKKMRAVIEAQAKKIKIKIANSGYYPGGIDAYIAANNE
jgi:phenylalanyl-tRNA synthetase alpha subunit